jgi:nicotinamidase-related amidase
MSTRYTGVSNLLAPGNCTLILIDHQPYQFTGGPEHRSDDARQQCGCLDQDGKGLRRTDDPDDGYEVFIVTDASGSVSLEAHERAVQRMVQAGATPLTWIGFASELQRDWAREKTIAGVSEIMSRHGGNIGIAGAWELQLLNTNSQKVNA